MKKNILVISSSPRGEGSYSTKVARALADLLKVNTSAAATTHRDLAIDPLPHIDEDYVVGRTLEPHRRTVAQQTAVQLSDTLIKELLAADVIIIASAMINLGPTSTLKTWFDYVIRPGVTFSYSEKGPQGLVTGKKVYLVQARGGIYSDGPMRARNFQEPYLKALLASIGLADIDTIEIEGIALGQESADKAVASAFDKISTISKSSWATANQQSAADSVDVATG